VFHEEFAAGGPLMYALLALWIVVLAGVLDRVVYLVGRAFRQPAIAWIAQSLRGDRARAARGRRRERKRAERGLSRIDAVSQLATSVGLFGTVVGIAQSFFARGGAQVASAEVLAAGLGIALYTTIAGLMVFLFGQAFLIAYAEWLSWADRRLEGQLESEAAR
jgi:biopolymer transport protein ExbB/TolQ